MVFCPTLHIPPAWQGSCGENPQLRWKVYNRGINGETTREAKERLESQVLWLKPHLTVILLGSNDSALNEGQYRTPWEYEHNMMFILERLLAKSTEIPGFP